MECALGKRPVSNQVHALTLTTCSWPNSAPNMSAVQPSTVCELTAPPLSTSDDSVSAAPA
jgi:hypothetical protein